MSTQQQPRRILQEAGPAAGRVTGLNHIVLFTRDMNEGVKFYRDLLGLRVVRTVSFSTDPAAANSLQRQALHSTGLAVDRAGDGSVGAPFVAMDVRQVFFEMGNGELFSLYEVPSVVDAPETSISSVLWPEIGPERISPPVSPQKMDHLCFNVDTLEDLHWFQRYLAEHGVAVTDVTERRGPDGEHRFITSIYFYDPSGNPLEIATFAPAEPEWVSYDFSTWFLDEHPVSALVEGADPAAETLIPRSMRR